MNQNEYDRLNLLSEKSLINKANSDELKEFTQLMNDWKRSEHYNLLQDLYNNKILPRT